MKRSVLILLLFNILSMGAGLIREVAIAYRFGTSNIADMFSVALILIDSYAAVVLFGLGTYMVVPVAVRLMNSAERDEDLRFIESLLFCVSLITIPLAAGVGWFADDLAYVLGPRLAIDPHRLLAQAIRWCAPAVPLVTMAGLLAGSLQAKTDYYSPVVGRAVFSIAIAVCVMTLGQYFGIRAAAAGIVAGSALQLVVSFGGLWRSGWRPDRPRVWHPAIRSAISIGFPTLSALTISHLGIPSLQRMIASGLPEGSFAAVSYAQRVVTIAANFSAALASVSTTELSHAFHSEGLSQTTVAGLKTNLDAGTFVLVPASYLVFLCSDSLVSMLFQRGHYTAASTALTGHCLRWFSLSLLPAMFLAVLLPALSALGYPWHTLIVTSIWTAATAYGTSLLLPALGSNAIPAAYSVGMLIASLTCLIMISRIVGAVFLRDRLVYACRLFAYSTCAVIPFLYAPLLRQPQVFAASVFLNSAVLFVKITAVFLTGFLLLSSVTRDVHVLSLWRSLASRYGALCR